MKIYYVAILSALLLTIGIILVILGLYVPSVYFVGEGALLALIYTQLFKESHP